MSAHDHDPDLARDPDPADDPLAERVVASEVVHRGRYMEFRVDTVERTDGTRGTRDVVGHPGAVAILAVDDAGRLLLVRQWRIAAGRALLEIPAGTLDVHDGVTEDPDVAARRELEEETGHRAGSWRKLATFWTAPGFASELMHLYLATDLAGVADGDERLAPDEDEHLELRRIPLDEALVLVTSGRIMDAKSILGVLWLDRMRREDRPYISGPEHGGRHHGGGDTMTKAIETGSDRPDGADGALVVRPFRAGDTGPVLEVMLETLDRGEYDGLARHHLETASAGLADEPDWSAVAEVDGRIAGWVAPHDDDLTVAPAFWRRGIGTRLVEAGRAIAARDGRDVLRLWVSRRPGPEAFARAMGMRYRSSLWQMRLPADIRPEPPRFPDDVRVRGLDSGLDETPFVDLVNTIFLDHPSPFRLTEAQVRRVHAMPGFDPTTILLVTDAAAPGRMMGFCRVHMFADDAGRPMGEVRLLGVRREARGRGIGRALTAWGIAEARCRGAGDVVLAVEGENDGATRIYEGLGLRREVEWPHWTMPSTDARGTDGG